MRQTVEGPWNGNGVGTPYVELDRAAWSRLRESTPLTLTELDLAAVRGLGDPLDLAEVADVYLPLSRLLNLHVAASQRLHDATATFLGDDEGRTPYVIGIAGSVAVGKSTTARILQLLLSRWPDHPRVRAGHHRRVPAGPTPSWPGAASCTARASRSPTTSASWSASSPR